MTDRNASRLEINAVLGVAMGAALGAAAMFMLDPVSGTRRRTVARQRTVRLGRKVQRFVGRASRDLAHRSQGVIAGVRRHSTAGDDFTVHERVRARIGHLISHPRAVDVQVHGGAVTLSGPILGDEADMVIAAVRKIPGVAAVFDNLERHQEAGHVPELQGGPSPRGRRSNLGLDAPGLQLLAGIAASFAILTVLARRGLSEPSPESLGEGEENPMFYRHLATTPPPLARSTREE